MGDIDHSSAVIKQLNTLEIIWIYNRYLRKDFPMKERRPLLAILRCIKRGMYECVGYVEEGTVKSYMFLVKNGNSYLVDYFAVVKEYRNGGLGSKLLRALINYYDNADSVILEVEDPEYATNEDERSIRERRINFYLRNEFVDTGVRTVTFGVEYLILQCVHKSCDVDEIKRFYDVAYRQTLGDRLFENNIRIWVKLRKKTKICEDKTNCM